MKKTMIAFTVFLLLIQTCACAVPDEPAAPPDIAPQSAVILSASLTELWLLAGGSLAGTTADTTERAFDAVPESVQIVGTVKEPNLEMILSLSPDYVIYSDELAGHRALEQALQAAEIPYYAAHVETMEDYLRTLEDFCAITGRADLYEQNGLAVAEQVDALLQAYIPREPQVTYLLMRVHSSGGKIIADDHAVCDILDALGAKNIAADDESLLSDLSLEVILESDPDYIFILTMGDEAAAQDTLSQMFTSQPAWQTLSAVQRSRVSILPKELFHYKPNANWGAAYATIIGLLAD